MLLAKLPTKEIAHRTIHSDFHQRRNLNSLPPSKKKVNYWLQLIAFLALQCSLYIVGERRQKGVERTILPKYIREE